MSVTSEERVSSFSFSFPFEGFDDMFVTKSGMAVVVLDSSTTVLRRSKYGVNKACRSALTVWPREWFLLKRGWFFFFFLLSSVFTAKAEEFRIPRSRG